MHICSGDKQCKQLIPEKTIQDKQTARKDRIVGKLHGDPVGPNTRDQLIGIRSVQIK